MGYLRVKEHTQRAINKIVGELQRQTGDSYSADAAVWHLIEQVFPVIADEERQEKEEDAKTNGRG